MLELSSVLNCVVFLQKIGNVLQVLVLVLQGNVFLFIVCGDFCLNDCQVDRLDNININRILKTFSFVLSLLIEDFLTHPFIVVRRQCMV